MSPPPDGPGPSSSVTWARDHLLAGCLSFSIFVGLAWICAVANEHYLYATLSEMVHDWSTPEGKIFIPALLLPAIFFLLSSHAYVLPNVRVEGHPWNHFFVVLRHFCVNAGLILVAFVPTLAEIDNHAHTIEVYIHGFAAAAAFGCFAAAELFVLSCHKSLSEEELFWRHWQFTFMLSCVCLILVHKSLIAVSYWISYSNAWTFRYEMLIGSGLIAQNSLIWCFSNPGDSEDSRFLRCPGFLAIMPHVGAGGIVISDFFYRGNKYGLTWVFLEVVFIALAMAINHNLLQYSRLHGKKWDISTSSASTYGAASSA